MEHLPKSFPQRGPGSLFGDQAGRNSVHAQAGQEGLIAFAGVPARDAAQGGIERRRRRANESGGEGDPAGSCSSRKKLEAQSRPSKYPSSSSRKSGGAKLGRPRTGA